MNAAIPSATAGAVNPRSSSISEFGRTPSLRAGWRFNSGHFRGNDAHSSSLRILSAASPDLLRSCLCTARSSARSLFAL